MTTMAYMSVMKGLDEKAKRKDVDGVFMRLDKNQNGLINFSIDAKSILQFTFTGKIYINDFINDLNDQSYQITEEERNKLVSASDGKGQVNKKCSLEKGSITSNPNLNYSYPRLPSLSTVRPFHFSKKATGTKIFLKSPMTTDMK